jgi:hypothetical protein
MKNNKAKSAQHADAQERTNDMEKGMVYSMPANSQPHGAYPFQAIDENSKLVRRYSLDDNGGGYTGL